jgi:predicted regulator of Ras-like GTPase activity (Roadblock/LC7/MglB family)
MQATPIVTIQAAEELLALLEEFLDKSEASYAVVIDRGGTILSQHGKLPEDTDPTILAALAAGSFAATCELALRIGESEFTALYQQGKRWHILMSAVDGDAVMSTIFGAKTTVGLVRFYAERTVKQVATVLESLRASTHVEPIFTERDLHGMNQMFGR